MPSVARSARAAALALAVAASAAGPGRAEPVAVRFREGLVHGFLTLHTLDGERLADGDLLQVARGDLVTARLVFRFTDGSHSEETTVYSQLRTFRLVSDRLVQRGPAFRRPMDVTIDVRAGRVSVVYTDDDGHKTASERLPDSHVWVLGGEAPAFVRSESPHFPGGPLWRIELTNPAWPTAKAPQNR